MKTKFIFFLIIFFSIYADAQQKIPKNYVSISGIGELSRVALGCGVEYERWLFTKNQFAAGAKAHHIFPSRTINPIFSSNESLQRNRQTQIMATSYFFTGQEKETSGFFLSLAAGVNLIKWEHEASDASGNYYIASNSEVAPGFDISFGGQFKSNRMAVRVTGGLGSFPAHKYKDYVNGTGILFLYSKVSIGF